MGWLACSSWLAYHVCQHEKSYANDPYNSRCSLSASNTAFGGWVVWGKCLCSPDKPNIFHCKWDTMVYDAVVAVYEQ